jgi:hypothetical protein
MTNIKLAVSGRRSAVKRQTSGFALQNLTFDVSRLTADVLLEAAQGLLGDGKGDGRATVAGFDDDGQGEARGSGRRVADEPAQGVSAGLLRAGDAAPGGDLIEARGGGLQRGGDAGGEGPAGRRLGRRIGEGGDRHAPVAGHGGRQAGHVQGGDGQVARRALRGEVGQPTGAGWQLEGRFGVEAELAGGRQVAARAERGQHGVQRGAERIGWGGDAGAEQAGQPDQASQVAQGIDALGGAIEQRGRRVGRQRVPIVVQPVRVVAGMAEQDQRLAAGDVQHDHRSAARAESLVGGALGGQVEAERRVAPDLRAVEQPVEGKELAAQRRVESGLGAAGPVAQAVVADGVNGGQLGIAALEYGAGQRFGIGQHLAVAVEQAAALHAQFGLHQAGIVVAGGQLRRAGDLPIQQAGSHQGKADHDRLRQAADVSGHMIYYASRAGAGRATAGARRGSRTMKCRISVAASPPAVATKNVAP